MRALTPSALALLALISAAKAQDAPATFTLTVTPAELQTIGKALGTQPYEVVAPILLKLQTQVVEQQKPKPVEEPKK